MTQTKIEGKFYPLTPEIGRKLREAKLTAAEWKLWSYLVEIDPFGDRYTDLPDTLTIMQEVDIKKTTFYTALTKFQKLELFDFQDKGFAFRNLTRFPKNRKAVRKFGKDSENSESCSENRKAVRKFGKDSENSESCSENRKVVRENGKVSENSENQSPEVNNDQSFGSSQTIQTTQTYQTLSDSGSEEKKAHGVVEDIEAVEVSDELSSFPGTNNSSLVKAKEPVEDKISPPRTTQTIQTVAQ